MRIKLSLLLCSILFNIGNPLFAQVFTENFDGGTVSMVSSGTPGFITTNAYSQNAPNSSWGVFNAGGVSTLTSPNFSTSGNQYVTLQFNHICKVSFFDSCVVELSINSGATWTQLNNATCIYLGASNNFPTTKWFGAFSYPIWDVNNPTTMANTWWKQELFDISSLCANQATVSIRFRMKDNNSNGMESFYGWLVDNIIVNAAACELQPPTVNIFQGPSGIVYTPVNTTIGAYVKDNSGLVATSQLNYSVNFQPYVPTAFNNVSDSTYIGYLPNVNANDSVCWYISASDICNNTINTPATCFLVLQTPCDFIAPNITIISGPQNVSAPAADSVSAAISDNTFIIVNPTLAYQINGGSYNYLPMVNVIASKFDAVLPGVNVGDNVCWYIQATDTCGNVGSSTVYCFIALNPDTVPYADNFESGSIGWLSNTISGSSWQLGMPAFGVTTGTHSGSNAWDVELNAHYLDGTNCELISPVFDFTGDTNATVSFWQNYYSEINWDGVRMEYTTDGTLWNVLGFMGDPNAVNWYNQASINSSGLPAWTDTSGGWKKSSYLLSAFDNAPFLQFRFIFTSDVSVFRDGHSIDDFAIRVPQQIDAGVETIISPVGTSPASMPVTMLIKNYGIQTITSMTVGVRVNNTTTQTQTWTGVLPSGQSTVFTTSFSINLTGGNNDFCAWAVPSGDGDHTNDTLCSQVYFIPTVSVPYNNNFENNSNDWYAPLPSNTTTKWELGTPAYSVTTGAHSGDTCWDINLNTAYTANAYTYIQSPFFNINGISDLHLSFWQNRSMDINDGFWIEADFDNAGSWMPLGYAGDPNALNWYNGLYQGTPVWNGNSITWMQSQYWMHSIGVHSLVAFRMVFASQFPLPGFAGVSMDDFTLNVIPAQDAGIAVLYFPNVIPAGTTSPLWQVAVHNFGTQTISNIPITITVNGVSINTFTYSGSILPGDSALVVVNGFLPPSGVFTLCANTSLLNDGDASDDQSCMTVTGVPVIVAPYSDNFDNGNLGWTTEIAGDPGTNWELGTPSTAVTNSSHSAPNCWDINLTTSYTNNALCYLYSPYFDYSVNAINPYVSFWQNYNVESPYEGMRVEYSLSGGPWNVLDDLNTTNWYNAAIINSSQLPGWTGTSPGWIQSKCMMNLILPSNAIQFRFVFSSDPSVNNFDGFSIDDFVLSGDLSDDLGVSKVVTPGVNSGAPLYTPVVLRVKNFGYNAQSAFDVSYSANGGSLVTTTYGNTLQPGDSVDITFNGFITIPGINSIKAYTSLNNDLLHYNDTVNFIFNAVFTTTPPFTDSFDVGNIGWTVDTSVTGTKWELGVPAFGSTNSVHSGSACWDVNLDFPYNNAATTRLISPVFNYTNSITSTLKFWTNYNMEYGQDGMQVEYTTDGVNFTRLGTYNDPNGINWYDNASVAAFGNTPAFSGSSLGWKQATYNTTLFGGSTYIQYAFVFKSDVNLSGDGVSVDDFELTSVVGLNELNEATQVVLQPNPARNNLTVTVLSDGSDNLCDAGEITLHVINVLGKEVLQKNVDCKNNSVKSTIDVTTLAPGVYFIQLESLQGSIVKKFVKQ